MRSKPAMYLGENTLTALSSFISGFYEGCNYENTDNPSFDSFNDFVGEYYGKYTTAGWKNLILADHYGNEAEAIIRFYEILDEFRLEENKPSARKIVMRLLQLSYIDFRGTSQSLNTGILSKNEVSDSEAAEIKQQLTKINRISDMLHNVPFQLTNAMISNQLHHFEDILKDIFERANGNNGLFQLIQNNIPESKFYEYEIWQGSETTTLIKSNHPEKEKALELNQKLINTFLAINDEKAKEVKDAFLKSLKIKKSNR
jgi:Asp-tRNA(Asn)/Glu-tRNA(Gln) amidotransferase C subunit